MILLFTFVKIAEIRKTKKRMSQIWGFSPPIDPLFHPRSKTRPAGLKIACLPPFQKNNIPVYFFLLILQPNLEVCQKDWLLSSSY